jgi:CheY-like chemotaxis protein
MRRHATASVILMADDDTEDREMTLEALEENQVDNPVRFVDDGEELMDYLHQRGRYASEGAAPRPALILLDLNMPKKDGCEALAEIKAAPALRHIPVVVFTTSRAAEDVFRSYDLGASSFITKPVTFAGLVDMVRAFERYWLNLVDLPPSPAQ